jgi:hypothetical protein
MTAILSDKDRNITTKAQSVALSTDLKDYLDLITQKNLR